jgi:hypothetical protein
MRLKPGGCRRLALQAGAAHLRHQAAGAQPAGRSPLQPPTRTVCWCLPGCSDVLADDTEPFAALPHGALSTPLFIAVRALCAPQEDADSWHSAHDVLGGAPPSGEEGGVVDAVRGCQGFGWAC